MPKIVDDSWKGAYKFGDVCLVLKGIFFILGFLLTIIQGQPLGTIEKTLTNIAGQKLLYQAANGAFVLVFVGGPIGSVYLATVGHWIANYALLLVLSIPAIFGGG